jgi:hypothetical protein
MNEVFQGPKLHRYPSPSPDPTHPLPWHLFHVPGGSQWNRPIPRQILWGTRQPLGRGQGKRWAGLAGDTEHRKKALPPGCWVPKVLEAKRTGTSSLTFAMGTGCSQGAWPALSESLSGRVPRAK